MAVGAERSVHVWSEADGEAVCHLRLGGGCAGDLRARGVEEGEVCGGGARGVAEEYIGAEEGVGGKGGGDGVVGACWERELMG